jgi:RNA polymerase sigma-70 factor (ECF subfamily)
MGHAPDPAIDVGLVRQVVAGSERALAELYDRHADTIYAAAYRLIGDRQTAEEVVQETFLALWNRAELFDPEVGSLTAWMLTIARNRSVDRLRAQGRRPKAMPFSATHPDDDSEIGALERLVATGTVLGGAHMGAGPEAELDAREARDAIRAALATMPEPERQVIVLAYAEDLSQSEIASQLGWPLGTVKTRTRRALRHLREALGGDLGPVDPSPLTPADA